MARSKQPEPPTRIQMLRMHLAPLSIIAALAAALVLGYWLLSPLQVPLPDPEHQTGVGESLDYLGLMPLTVEGPPLELDDLAGRVILLNFWGTWCPPCSDELPQMAELRRRYAGQDDFLLLAVSCFPGGGYDDVESLREETAEMLKQLHVDLPTYYDPHSATLRRLDDLIDFRGYPTTVLLDRSGVIRAVWVGYRPGMETEMERHVGTVLEEERQSPLSGANTGG